MRVLLLNNRAAPSGGAEAMVGFTRRLLEAAGHEVRLFSVARSAGDPVGWPRSAGAGTTGARAGGVLSGVWSRPAFAALSRELSHRSYDVAHAHNVYEGLTLSTLDALDAHGVPTALTVHDYRPICPNGLMRRPDGQLCRSCLDAGRVSWPAVRHRCVGGSLALSAQAAAEASVNRLRRRYERIGVMVAPSRHTASALASAGLPADRVRVVPNAVAPAPARGEPPARPRFLFVGRLTEYKGLDVLLSAAARLDGRADFAVLGEGRCEPALRARIAADRLPVELLGHGTPLDVARELGRASALVVPSLWFEVCPLVILEAFARGVPVVASDLGGMAELVEHEHCGLRVPPGETGALAGALARLARDPHLVRRLGLQARARSLAEHGPERHLAGLLDAYALAVEGVAAPRSGAKAAAA